uniref:Integrin alpha-2 domain-containing protein n=1 Tax=Strigamia maritima TaxID=126957 RepID=T1JAK7_STRMM
MYRPFIRAGEAGGVRGLSRNWLTAAAVLRVILLLGGIGVARAFNMDLNSFVMHRGPDDAMFGFAVAQHRDRATSWLLVGAPQANTRQPNVTQGGAVYRCSTETANDCQEIVFDRTGPRYEYNNGQLEQIDEKSGQWFGATIHSSGPNGVIVDLALRSRSRGHYRKNDDERTVQEVGDGGELDSDVFLKSPT